MPRHERSGGEQHPKRMLREVFLVFFDALFDGVESEIRCFSMESAPSLNDTIAGPTQ